MARPTRWTEVSKRGPAPPLLRPQRRWTPRTLLLALLLCLGGALAGVIVGLGLRPPPAEPVEIASGPPPTPSPVTTAPAETGGLDTQLAALRRAVEEERARLDTLIRARTTAEAEQQARLDALTRARMVAEGQLAALQRDLAAAQRELAGSARRDTASPPGAGPSPAPARAAREAPTGGGQPRVFVHHRAGSASAAETAAALVGPLREGGFEVPDLRAATAVPSQRVVRYFHAEDAATAARLAGRLGRGWAIQDFRGYEPSPGSGTLEVWVPDR